jgi:hypothetical protein
MRILAAVASVLDRRRLAWRRLIEPGWPVPAPRARFLAERRSLGDARIDAGQLYEIQLRQALRRGVSVQRPVSPDLKTQGIDGCVGKISHEPAGRGRGSPRMRASS